MSGIRVAVAFDDPPLEPDPTWTQLVGLAGCSVQRCVVDRGRLSEFDKTGTGTAAVSLIGQAGVLDPTNTGGAFFGQIMPDKQAKIELRDPVLDEWHVIFRGFVEDWDFTLDLTRQFLSVDLSLVDGFAVMNDYQFKVGIDGDAPPAGSEGNVFYEATPATLSERINAILDDIGWPEELRDVSSGNVRALDTVYAPGSQGLAALFDAADAEFPGVANCYMSKDGIFVFHGRQPRFRPDVAEYGISRRDVGDPSVTVSDDTICPVSELGFNIGKANLFNSVHALPQGAEEANVADQYAEDTMSIDEHGRKSLSFIDLLTQHGIATGNDALEETLNFAVYYKENYSVPRPRVNRLVFKTKMPDHRLAAPLWKHLTRCEISDLLTLQTEHPGGGGFDEGFYVEGIHYDIRPGNDVVPIVVLTCDVSPQALWTTNPFDDDPDPE